VKVAIAGANGFIGRAICAALVERAYATTAIVRRQAAVADLPPGAAPLVIGNYADAADVRRCLPEGDCLIHAAGRAHVLAGDQQASAYRQANVEGTRALAEAAAARGYRRFVFLSSIGVLGAHDAGTPFTEESPPAPAWPYAATKLEAELALFAIGRATGLEISVLRPPLVYGPGNRGNFPRLMRWVRSGLPIPLASVHNARSYMYVGNLADAAANCAAHPGAANRMFLVADGTDWSTPAMVRLIAEEMVRPARLWPMPVAALRLAGHLAGKGREIGSLTDSLRIDSSLLRDRTAWSAPYGTAEGVAQTVRWFMDSVGTA
jgi:nucleoside-diphosphate-sugar epimerase